MSTRCLHAPRLLSPNALSALLIAVAPGIGLAQTWVEYVDETTTRLIADPGLGSADPEEKDYAFADLDQDGDIDLISVRKQEWTTTGRKRNVLFMNEGIAEGHAINGVLVDRSVEYASASDVPGSAGFLDLTNDRDVVVVDVDGDGWLDFVTATTLSGDQDKYISHLCVYINLGDDEDGNWLGFIFDDEDRTPTMPDEPRFCAVAAGDIDADGDQDLYFADYQQGPYGRDVDLNDRLYINDGTGYFTDESSLRMTTEMLESSFGMAAVIADMNGDGALDILKDDGLNSPQAISISYNDPDSLGHYPVGNYKKPIEQAPYHVVVGDLNNDGRPDMIESDDGSDHYLLNNGNGGDDFADFSTFLFSFTGGETDDGFASDNYIFDLNNDGWNDVLIADVDVDISGCSRRMHIYRNLGNAPNVTLQEQTEGTNCSSGSSQTCTVAGITNAKLQGTHDVAVFDINNDGWLDLVVGRCSSTEVYMNQPPIGMVFSYPLGLPVYVTPGQDLTLQIQVTGTGSGVPEAGSLKFFLSIDGSPFVETPVTPLGADLYEASLPEGACLTAYEFYFTVEEASTGTLFSDPTDAPDTTFGALSALGEEITLRDEIEGDVSGWIIENDPLLTGGAWQQADPNQAVHTCGITSPEDDATAGDAVMAFVTQNGGVGSPPGSADVDGGPTWLTSPVIDLAGSDATISYSQWFVSCLGTADVLTVEVSNDDGDSWVLVETVTGTGNEWETTSFLVTDYVTPTDKVRVRFSTVDSGGISITEAGIDNFEVRELICPEETPGCEGDANGDGLVDPLDAGYVLARFGCSVGTGDPDCDAADQNGDSVVDPLDYGFVQARFGPCE